MPLNPVLIPKNQNNRNVQSVSGENSRMFEVGYYVQEQVAAVRPREVLKQ